MRQIVFGEYGLHKSQNLIDCLIDWIHPLHKERTEEYQPTWICQISYWVNLKPIHFKTSCKNVFYSRLKCFVLKIDQEMIKQSVSRMVSLFLVNFHKPSTADNYHLCWGLLWSLSSGWRETDVAQSEKYNVCARRGDLPSESSEIICPCICWKVLSAYWNLDR